MGQKVTHLLSDMLILLLSVNVRADHLRAQLLLGSTLDGAQKVPAMTTAARGVASFTPNAMFIFGSFSGLSGPIVVAHTHLGFWGVAGPVVTDLFRFIRASASRGISQDLTLTGVSWTATCGAATT